MAATKRHRTGIWSGIGHDVRTAARRLAGQPASTAFTIITLALAIGVAAAVFSVVDQMILRPPPFLHGDRLVNVMGQTGPGRSGGTGLTAEKISAGRSSPRCSSGWKAISVRPSISPNPPSRNRWSPASSRSGYSHAWYQDARRTAVHRGRRRAGQRESGHPLARVLDDAVRGLPGALGSQLVLNDERYTIVGVLRPRVTLFTGDEPVWLPFDLHAWGTRAPYRFIGIGRLNVALDVGRARPAAGAIAAKLDESTPIRATWHLGIEEKRSAQLAASARQTLFVLLGAVALLLLLACVTSRASRSDRHSAASASCGSAPRSGRPLATAS